MGCDIHYVVERRKIGVGDKWVGIYASDVHPYPSQPNKWYRPLPRERNYNLFAEIAGVRGEGKKPLGVPIDASDLTLAQVGYWDNDGHSHSFMSAEDFCKIWIKCREIQEDRDWDEYILTYNKILTPERLNEINKNRSEAREILDHVKEYPMYSLFGIDDDHEYEVRIVFWFDN